MPARLLDTQRLGFVAHGRWTRQDLESTPWREPEDALRFQDIRQDVACSVTTAASGHLPSAIKLLEASRVPGLQGLPTMLRTNPAPVNRHSPTSTSPSAPAPPPDDGAPLTDPCLIKPFADW